MKKQWWLGALALVVAGCGGDGDDNNGGGGGNVIASATVVAMTDDERLVVFDTNAPGVLLQEYSVSGLPDGDPVASIDLRPAAESSLYVVTQSGAIYTVSDLSNNDTLPATLVGSMITNGNDVREVDFNPVVDRLRVAAEDGTNFRAVPETALTTPDSDFSYDGVTPVQIEGVAYTNSFEIATTTVLYGIDTGRDALVRIDPPNTGTLTEVGRLGVNLSGRTPFDISPADETLGFIAQESDGRSRILSVDITDGSTVRGRLTPSGVRIVGMAVLPNA